MLPGMSEKSGDKAFDFLVELGVKVKLGTRVTEFDGEFVHTKDGQKIRCKKVVWAAGITGKPIKGFAEETLNKHKRFRVDGNLKVENMSNVYAIGDAAACISEENPFGHPQVAQTAIQQAKHLAKQFKTGNMIDFKYKDLGSMATIGRNKAVADIGKRNLSGFIAWIMWLFVHLFAIVGVKNKLLIFFNWTWNYLTYDQSLRLIIKPLNKKKKD